MNIKKSILIGIITVIIGTIISFLLGDSLSVELPVICNSWNKYHVMEISLFFTGSVVYIILDLIGYT